MLPKLTLAPNSMFRTLAKATVYGPTRVFFRYLSYPKMANNKIEEISSAGMPTSKDKISAIEENTTTRVIADFLDILPDGRGLFGLSFLSISKSYRSFNTMPTQYSRTEIVTNEKNWDNEVIVNDNDETVAIPTRIFEGSVNRFGSLTRIR